MNKNTVQLDKNTYVVTNEKGDTRIVSTLNSNDKEVMKKILLKEDDIEQIELILTQNNKNLILINEKNKQAKLLNITIYIALIIAGFIILPTTSITTSIFSLTLLYLVFKKINHATYGTKKQRKQKEKEANENIPFLEEQLEKTKKKLEKLKEETKFTELTNINQKSYNSPKYSYVYKYDPNNCNYEELTEEELNKEVHVMKLSKIPRNPFVK